MAPKIVTTSGVRAELERLLAGGLTQVRINGAATGVDLPWDLLADPSHDDVELNLSHRFGPDYPVELTEDGVVATLRFAGRDRRIAFPYTAVVAAVHLDTTKQNHAPATGSLIGGRGHLRLVK